MKKCGVLNAQLSGLIAGLGHKDLLMIGDAGMPVPPGIPIVDLAVCCGVPAFAQVAEAVLQEVCVEAYYCADETAKANPEVMVLLKKHLPEAVCETMSHESLKEYSRRVKFAVRTGENTPYANVILQSGVVF